jgi:light-regulated signal transduction histidine kinase (bacteriophytochrome)
MRVLIEDLLRFSKHSFQPDDMKETDLNVIIADLLLELDFRIAEAQAIIDVGQLPVICAIPSLIHQLFYNLLSNAIKFRKKDIPPLISIRAERYEGQLNPQEDGLTYYIITITDNGIGFNANFAEDIFKVFKRLHSYHEYQGTGVGLSICKKIVENHNGFITAESVPGQGSTFSIILPEK